jgi:hypothetical protein
MPEKWHKGLCGVCFKYVTDPAYRAHYESPKCRSTSKPGWGDRIEAALTKRGITKEKVEKILGRPCGCDKRKRLLNRLGRWAESVLGT